MKRYTVPLLLAFITLITGVYYYLFHFNFFRLPQLKNQGHSINAFSNNSLSREYNKNGQLIHVLRSTYSEHFPQPNHMNYTNPHLTITNPNQPTWHIKAKHSQSFPAQHKVILWDDVILHRPAQSNTTETTIKTQHLVYYKIKQLAISNTFTTVTEPGSTASGDRVTANMKTNVTYIQQHSSGKFAPLNKSVPTQSTMISISPLWARLLFFIIHV